MEGILKYFPPDLFGDEDRIRVLYAPFRDKSVNPKGYESKLKTWREAVTEYMRQNKIVWCELDKLSRAFNFQDKKPLCLGEVLRNMIEDKRLVTENDYSSTLQTNDRGWISWGVGLGFNYLVKKPASLTFNWAWSTIVGSDASNIHGNFVCSQMVEELSEKLYEYCCEANFRDRVASNESSVSALDDAVELDLFRRETRSITDDEKTLSILIASLHNRGKVQITKVCLSENVEKTFLSFGGAQKGGASPVDVSLALGAAVASSTPCKSQVPKKEVTEKERTLLQLGATAKALVEQMESIHAEMEKLQGVAKSYVAKGIKPLALNALKRKKMLQVKLEAKEKSLDNLEVMISKLQDVDSNKMVFSAYKDAVAALNKSLSETDVDSIEDTIDDMKELLEKQEEIQVALSGKALDRDEDADELELELEGILNESDEDRSKIVFPEIPTNELLDKLCISPLKPEKIKVAL